MEILRGVESSALAVREAAPAGAFMTIDETQAQIELPMERPLHRAAAKTAIASLRLESGDEGLDAESLFSQFAVDKALLAGNIRQALQQRSQVTLAELLQEHPLRQGLS